MSRYLLFFIHDDLGLVHDGFYKEVMKRRDIEDDPIGQALLHHDRTMNKLGKCVITFWIVSSQFIYCRDISFLSRRLSKIDMAERLERAEAIAAKVEEAQAAAAKGSPSPPRKRLRGSQF